MRQELDTFNQADLDQFRTECEKLQVPMPVILAYLKIMRKKGISASNRLIISDRRIIAALDQAVQMPNWWRANRIHYFCPKMTLRQIAQLIDTNLHTVSKYLGLGISEEVWEGIPLED